MLFRSPLYRRLGSRVFKLFVHAVMGLPLYISDTQCGFKLYRREVAQALYGAAFTDGFMFDTEIIMRALRASYRILEFPVLWSNDPDTRFNPVQGTIRNLRELTTLRYRMSAVARGVRRSEAAQERVFGPDAPAPKSLV